MPETVPVEEKATVAVAGLAFVVVAAGIASE